MKSILKRLLGPLVRKLEGRITRLVTAAVRSVVMDELKRTIQPALDVTRAEVHASCDRTEEVVTYLRRSAEENGLLLDSLVRELVRIQMQLESLPRTVPFEPEEAVAEERLMIG